MKKFSSIRCLPLVGVLLLVTGALPLLGQEDTADAPATPPPAMRGVRAASSTPAAGGPTAPFAATIYELHMPADQIGRLDIEALTKAAATPQAFDKALAALGTAHVSYLVNQSVQLASDTIRIGTQVPYVTNSQVTNKGDIVNSVAYTNIEAIFTLSGKILEPSQKDVNLMDVNLNVQVSALTDGGLPISSKVTAPFFRSAQMAHKGPVQAGKPFVLVSADGASPDAEGKAIVIVTRVTLGTPE